MENLIDFPLKEFNLSFYLKAKYTPTNIYDLYAVIYHYGDLNFGHYNCKILVDDEWFTFDDQDVIPVEDLSSIVNQNAFILFYKRREI